MKNNIIAMAFITPIFAGVQLISTAAVDPCVPGQVESDNACAGTPNCVEVKTKQYCDGDNKSHKKYFVEANVETVTIEDSAADAVLIVGSNRWKFDLSFFDEQGVDVSSQLQSSANLRDHCDGTQCRWELHGGGLTKDGHDKTYKYTIKKHKNGQHNVEPLDPSVIIKPTK